MRVDVSDGGVGGCGERGDVEKMTKRCLCKQPNQASPVLLCLQPVIQSPPTPITALFSKHYK